ncbi:MAG: DUF2027 domain-containing protein [Bacteroidales bacterium]|nr:DUF2027 domain-containing protein [Bacteroidales bacterium]MDZ4204158.1 DUF2027 domain-containing protein [Bacteroidales bacterium]
MKFKPGDKVRFLNEKGGGIITRIISQQLVSVAIEDGFEIPTLSSELLKIETDEQPGWFFGREESAIGSKSVMPQARYQETGAAEVEKMVFPIKVINEKPDQGVYLAFCPTDQQWLITGDVNIYLLNATEFNVIYTFNLKHPNIGWMGTDYDVIPPESGITVSLVSRDELANWHEGVVQMLFQKEEQSRLIAPLHSAFKLKMSRLLKEDNYIVPSFHHQRMILVKLADTVHGDVNATNNEGRDIEATKAKHITIEKNQALIDRHCTVPSEAEVDLHISALRDDYAHLSKHEILKLQIDYFKRTLDSALMHQYRKIIYIHGIGNGVLRDGLLQQLHEYEELRVQTASFERYGYGAIEVLNPNPQ